jgi:hypothetical protein
VVDLKTEVCDLVEKLTRHDKGNNEPGKDRSDGPGENSDPALLLLEKVEKAYTAKTSHGRSSHTFSTAPTARNAPISTTSSWRRSLLSSALNPAGVKGKNKAADKDAGECDIITNVTEAKDIEEENSKKK